MVVGAGLAGLTTAYRLYQKGYPVEVYVAQSRVGGRVHSVLIKNFDGEDSIAEVGAQNITDGGEAVNLLSLARELGIDILAGNLEFTGVFYDGKNFYEEDLLLLP